MRESYEPSPKGEGGRGPDRGRMRGEFALIARKRIVTARLPLIRPLRGQLPPSREA